jgi:hypothetical protein
MDKFHDKLEAISLPYIYVTLERKGNEKEELYG